MSVEKKFKVALDETRLLMLGSQIFFGFQFNGIFQTAFDTLPDRSKWLDAAALVLMALTLGCLIAPSARHRIAEDGQVDYGLFRATTIFAGVALFPFSLSLAIDIYIVAVRILGDFTGLLVAALFWVAALTFWYGLEFWCRDQGLWNTAMNHGSHKRTALSDRIDHMLTEARVALPGAQALLGFQLLAVLSQSFDSLPAESKLLHAAALGCVALTVILLVAPAAFHRIAFNGADSERFHRIGSRLVTAALFPLAFGLAGDIYVAIAKLTDSPRIGGLTAVAILLMLLGLWYGYPFALRNRGIGSSFIVRR
jgi:hypothetical protein